MASLKKRPGSDVWQAQFYITDLQTGKLRQIRRSTGHKSRKKAMAAAIDFERAEQGIVAAGSDKGQKAKAILADAVAEIEKETFTSQKARKYLNELLSLATGEEIVAYSTQGWLKEWTRRKSRDSSPATMARYNSHATAFLDWLGDMRRDKPLETVTVSTMRAWRESLQDQGLTGKTVSSYLKDIGAAYRAAIRDGIVHFNPVGALEPIAMDDSQSRKPFSGAEVAALLKAAPSREWRGLILVAAFTGLRLGDSSKLSWASVDLAGKKITLIPSKTKRKKREVCIPIQPDLLAYLEETPISSDDPEEPVFATLSQVSIGARAGLSQTFNRIMRDAGVDRGKASRKAPADQSEDDTPEAKGSGRITYERGFHSLRHTFTSWLRNAGVSEEDRMALTGHSTRDSHAIYSHHDEAALRSAVSKLPSLAEE